MKTNKQTRNQIGFDESDFKKVNPMRNDKADAVFKRGYLKALEEFEDIINKIYHAKFKGKIGITALEFKFEIENKILELKEKIKK